MQEAFEAAVSHPDTDARAMGELRRLHLERLGNQKKGLALTERAVSADPGEPAYHITLARMFIVLGELDKARAQVLALRNLNIGGRLDGSIRNLEARINDARSSKEAS